MLCQNVRMTNLQQKRNVVSSRLFIISFNTGLGCMHSFLDVLNCLPRCQIPFHKRNHSGWKRDWNAERGALLFISNAIYSRKGM